MTYSDYKKVLKQIGNKKSTDVRFKKYNTPKERGYGRNHKKCVRCGNINGHIGKYKLNLCRQCFREIAQDIGFKKYN